MENLSDKEIVERVINGEKELFGHLLDRYSNLAFKLALNITHDHDCAEDIVQESFMAAYENLEYLKNPSAFASWLSVITRNNCMKLLKNKKIAVSIDDLVEAGQEPASIDQRKDENNIYDEKVMLLRKLIVKLPQKYREVMDLRYTKEFSYEKLSGFLGIPVSTAKMRLFHARKLILKALRKEGAL